MSRTLGRLRRFFSRSLDVLAGTASRSASPSRRPGNPRRACPGVEVLERRELLSATVPGFTLDQGGNLYQTAAGQTQLIDTGVQNFAVVNNQVFDLHTNEVVESMNSNGSGKATVGTGVHYFRIAGNGDVIMLNTLGQVYEHTPGGAVGNDPLIRSGVLSVAIAGNGDVIMLTTPGLVYEHTPGGPTARDSLIGSSVRSIAIAGNGDVIQLNTLGQTFEHTPGVRGGHDPQIGSSVVTIAIAGNGDVIQLNTLGQTFEHTPGARGGHDPLIGSSVQSIAIAGNGDVIQLNTLGQTFEHTPGVTGRPDPQIGSSVTAIAVAGNGDVIQLTGSGLDFEHTPGNRGGNDPCIGSSVVAIAIAGNGDVIQLTNVGLDFEHTPGGAGNDPCIGSSVKSIAIAGNGDVIQLTTPGLAFEHTPGATGGADPLIGSSVQAIAIAGNGDVIQFTTAGTVYEHTPGAAGPDPLMSQFASAVISVAVGYDGVYFLRQSGDLYRHTPTGDVFLSGNVFSMGVGADDCAYFLLRSGDLYRNTPTNNDHVSGSVAAIGFQGPQHALVYATAVKVTRSKLFGLLHDTGVRITIYQQWNPNPLFTQDYYDLAVYAYLDNIIRSAVGAGYVPAAVSSGSSPVSNHGGAVLPNVEAQALYYGSAWATDPAQQATRAYLDGFLNYVVGSPYMDMLTQAGYGVGRGTATNSKVYNVALGGVLTDSAIQAGIQDAIRKGLLAAPDPNRLYIIYVPQNVEVINDNGPNDSKKPGGGKESSVWDFAGYHGAFAGTNASGHAVTIHYAVVTTPGGQVGNGSANAALGVKDEMTAATSHELAEAATDPNVNYSTLGWYDDARNGEIGDIVQKTVTPVNNQFVKLAGYVVQKESDKFEQAIAPDGSTGL